MVTNMIQADYTPVIIAITAGMEESEWLSYRRKGIGGSDVAALLGISPFCTARDLYYDKVGIKPAIQEETNWVAKEVGHRLEGLVAEIFGQMSGLKPYHIQKMFARPDYPFMQADIDYFVDMPDGEKAIVECKTSSQYCKEHWANNQIPENYVWQCRHYMSVMNVNTVFICCLFGNSEVDFIYRRIDRDYAIEEKMIAAEKAFWEEYVLKKEEPPYTEPADLVLESIRRHYGPTDPLTPKVVLNEDFIEVLAQYCSLRERKKELEAESRRLKGEMDNLSATVMAELGTAETALCATADRRYEVTNKFTVSKSIGKDAEKRMQLTAPQLFEQYASLSERKTFAVKEKSAPDL